MKSILLSIQPKWVAKILNGGKTIEVRKQFPKDYVGWVYIYCTKDRNNTLMRFGNGFALQTGDYARYFTKNWQPQDALINGKVVARFWCDKVSEIKRFMESDHGEFAFAYWDTKPFPNMENIETKSCLTTSELDNYASSKGKIDSVKLNAIHISKLEIFDEPKELKEFYTTRLDKTIPEIFDNSIQLANGVWVKPLTKAPQNYFWVEE